MKHAAPGPTTEIIGCLEPGCHIHKKDAVEEPAEEPALEGRLRQTGGHSQLLNSCLVPGCANHAVVAREAKHARLAKPYSPVAPFVLTPPAMPKTQKSLLSKPGVKHAPVERQISTTAVRFKRSLPKSQHSNAGGKELLVPLSRCDINKRDAVQVPDIVSRPTKGAGGVNFQTYGCLKPGCNIQKRDAVQVPEIVSRPAKTAPGPTGQIHECVHPGCRINGVAEIQELAEEPVLESRAMKHSAGGTSFQTHGKLPHP
ncbi:hypothetical protein LZ31DRAFT_598336 [Colletotrichum somersetense]|nr:hypothetical protein LZ31DRAFT_598336 [Colletotrichum somersetense]